MDALERDFRDLRNAIVGKRLADLELEELVAIEARLETEGAAMLDQLRVLDREAQASIDARDWPLHEQLRAKTLNLSERFDDNRDLVAEVIDAREQVHMERQLIARFGSRRGLMIWDFTNMVLIVLVVSLLVFQEVFGVSDQVAFIFDIADVVACLVFLVDIFAFRMPAAADKRWFLRNYWIDMLTSIPIPTSVLRAGRVVRLARLARMVRLFRLMRIVRAILFFWRGMDKLTSTLDVKLMRRSLKLLVVVLLGGGLLIWWAESDIVGNNAGVENLWQGLWWSFTTVVTGGFGDIHNPHSAMGRALTILLVIAGMVVVGLFTATLTSVLVREEDATLAIEELRAEFAGVRDLLEDATRRAGAEARGDGPPR